jgi:hypothetical protein
LAAILTKGRDVLQRDEWLVEVLEAMQHDLNDDRFSAAAGHFREALCLSHGFPALKAKAGDEAVRHLRKLLPRNWRVAEVLLQEAVTTEPSFNPDADLQEQFQAARYEELITGAIYRADRAQFDGTIEAARARLKELLREYPREKRLADRLDALERRREPASNAAPQASEPLSNSGASLALYDTANALVAAKLKRAEELLSKSTWSGIRNFATLAATSAMLAAAGFLIWQHFSDTGGVAGHPLTPVHTLETPRGETAAPRMDAAGQHAAPQTVSAVPVVAVNQPAPDEQAWQAVKTSEDAVSLRAFLLAFPASPHAYRVKMKLAAMEWASVDKTKAENVETYLKLHSRTPYRVQAEQVLQDLNQPPVPEVVPSPDVAAVNPADKDAILEAVRAYLAAQPPSTPQSFADVMDEPVVNGDQASIQLHPKAGGDSPSFTLSLVKTPSGWKVQSVQ